jgi:hypothetical protein
VTLPERYDDTMPYEWANGDDARAMGSGVHFDYGAQRWIPGHDHAHIVSNDASAPLLFCGADRVTCERANAHELDAWRL